MGFLHAFSVHSSDVLTLVEVSPDGRDWIYEIKYDGHRVVGQVRADRESRRFPAHEISHHRGRAAEWYEAGCRATTRKGP